MAGARPAWAPLRQRLRPEPRLLRVQLCIRTYASETEAVAPPEPIPELANLEPDSSLAKPRPQRPAHFISPRARARTRTQQLPAARYQYHPPKYRRGRFHPVQSPPSSNPISREFIPGPFSIPRLKETFQTSLASDIMTLTYKHKPPGVREEPIGERLRAWDGSSPYHKNRGLRPPRGKRGLRPVERDIDFTNVPEVREITVSTYVPKGIKNPDLLVVARMVVQAITGVVPMGTKAQKDVAQWKIKEGQWAGYKATLYGDRAYDFLDRCIHHVLPRIKEWKGVSGQSGDGSGNIAWGLTQADVALFPEIEVNQAAYPPKSIPGLKIFVKTTAKSNRHARLLLQGLGLPFHGPIGLL